jgi:hypothetical protein
VELASLGQMFQVKSHQMVVIDSVSYLELMMQLVERLSVENFMLLPAQFIWVILRQSHIHSLQMLMQTEVVHLA